MSNIEYWASFIFNIFLANSLKNRWKFYKYTRVKCL